MPNEPPTAARPCLRKQRMLALSSFITQQSQGMPTTVSIHGPAAPWLERGKDSFFQRRGQLNLACHQCHDESWGKMLRGDQVSQGQPNGFPAYRLEWQSWFPAPPIAGL